MKYDLVALGELLIDFTPVSEGEGGLPVLEAHGGGAPPNLLAALSRYGGRGALMAKVGRDRFGEILIHRCESFGIGTEGILMTDQAFTTLAFVTLGANGARDFSFARKPGADTTLSYEEIDLALLDSARFFHHGTLSLTHEPAKSATQRAVEYAKKKGKFITFDPNLRPPLWESLDDAREAMLWGLRHCDLVKISHEEVQFLFGLEPEDGARHIAEQFGVSGVFVTGGEKGVWYQTALARGFVPAFPVTAVDTTGAGDIFFGSLLSEIIAAGKTPSELDEAFLQKALRFANAAAGLSTTQNGGMESVPPKEAVLALLNV